MGETEKHEDVNRKLLDKDFKQCIRWTSYYGRSVLYETCDIYLKYDGICQVIIYSFFFQYQHDPRME